MRKRVAIVLAAGLLSLGGADAHAGGGKLAVVGLDKDGKSFQLLVSQNEYERRIRESILAVSDSIVPSLEKRDGKGGWALRTAVVGIGIGVEVGIGPILKVKAVPRFRLAYSNSKEPVIP